MVLLVREVVQVDLKGPQLRDLEVKQRVLSDEVLGEAVGETVLEAPLLGKQITEDDVVDQGDEVPVQILGGHDNSFLVVVIIAHVKNANCFEQNIPLEFLRIHAETLEAMNKRVIAYA